jgi:hypothetical protein
MWEVQAEAWMPRACRPQPAQNQFMLIKIKPARGV